MKKRLFLSLFDWLIPMLAFLDAAFLPFSLWRRLLWLVVLAGVLLLEYRAIRASGDEERIRRYKLGLVFYITAMAFILLMGLIHLLFPG